MEKIIMRQRDSNIELYRIIVMAMIMIGHYVVNSGLYQVISKDPLNINSIYYYLIGGWGKTGINCFVLITGYFMCKSNITVRKYLKLILEVIFYNVIIYLIFAITQYSSFSLRGLLLSFFPIKHIISNDFASCFLAFFLFIPFLNILINNMKRKQHLNLIIISLITCTIIPQIPSFQFALNPILWFSVLYFVPSYIRMYDFKYKDNLMFWLALSLICLVLSFLSVIVCLLISHKIGVSVDHYYFLVDSNALMAVMTSISLFNLFRNIRIPYNKYINAIASSMFGVFLIHANSDTMRQWLWCDFFANHEYYTGVLNGLRVIGVVILVMIVCVIIDQVRIHTAEKFAFKYIDRFLDKKNLK